jgi:ribosomal protein S18 acetylase RimI-like enzyme
MEAQFSPLTENDVEEVVAFFDRWSGKNFYTNEEVNEILKKSRKASFVARVADEVAGIRLTYAPGDWSEEYQQITPNEWKVPRDRVGYFKSLFVSDKFQKMGIGKTLSSKSIEVLKELGAEAILCHSWLESPNNSSQIYLKRMGFESVKEHENFWYDVPYLCVRCKPDKCICTGVEMIKYI